MPKKAKEVVEVEQIKEVKEPVAEQSKLIVYADFETFKAGNEFVVPDGWVRDEGYEQTLLLKQKKRQGMSFRTPKDKLVTVPVKEM